ncbi:MAG: Isoleucine-tRNA ligase, partial [Parcubacteria group bacterium GW2011_GWC2_39_11]
KGVKVRQPLRELRIRDKELGNEKKLLELIKDEVNVKNIVCGAKIEKEVELDFEISEELKREGDRRELVRNINKIRKETGLTPIDLIIIESDFEVIGAKENLMKEVKAKDYIVKSEIKNGTEVTISGKKYFVKITKS